MLNVQERENVILQQAAAAKKAGRKLYIYGAAVGGKTVYDALIKNKISPDGFCVDSQYYKVNQYFCGLPVVSVDALGGG